MAMKLTTPYEYLPLTRSTENGIRKYNTPDGKKLPSVTSILSVMKDMAFLQEWANSIGHDAAEKIVAEAAMIGSSMHDNLEKYVLSHSPPSGLLMTKQLTKMIINKGLCNVTEVWGTEVGLYTTGLYAGTTDLLGCHKGVPAVMDYKNSRNPKKKEWITDYFCQLAAYAISHNEMYGTEINKGVVMIACRDGTYQEFIIEGDEFTYYETMWCNLVLEYYNTVKI